MCKLTPSVYHESFLSMQLYHELPVYGLSRTDCEVHVGTPHIGAYA